MAAKRGYFPRLEALLRSNSISVQDVVTGTGLVEKSVRRMVNRNGYSQIQSVESVVNFLNQRGLKLVVDREFVAAEL